MVTVTKTDVYCPCCNTELVNVKLSDIESEDQCFNCGYTKSKDESNVKEGIF